MKNNFLLRLLFVLALPMFFAASASAAYHCMSAGPAQALTEQEYVTQAVVAEPIYIGGTLYRFSKENFTPVYEYVEYQTPCELIRIRKLVAYTATIPVYGDNGQQLIFDINGRSDGKVMTLTASCGSFSATDSGDKYVMFKQMATNQSCSSMELTFAASGAEAGMIELSVLIAEVF
ncbi:hypothetical protein [Thalassomonas haliotis]|uniref:Uncharacterized protein n=1 Tax=Thalassomonas haliotis TaxID=485448 RepID=A0ABY7VDZ5_9GAMM|nr:hypothetical protein [Thalassomonas haliotis]WDE11879.1 hypothetical protein H3N35_27445 [Thalassomonas haliotis]